MLSPPAPAQPGRRIAVVGTSGAGKSHVARTLAQRLGIPYICNDSIIWGPHWTPTPGSERLARFRDSMAGDTWTFDGNFGSLRDPEDQLILARIDTLIWLDLPRYLAHWQLFLRTIWRAWSQEPLWHDNRESWRLSFASRDSVLLWALRTHRLRHRQYAALFADPRCRHIHRIRLRSRRDVNRWLAAVSP